MSLRDSGRLVHEELRRAAEASGDFPWLRFSAGGVHTLGEVRQRASQLAGGLLELGVNKGDRVALLIDNRVEFIESWFATHMIGAIVVPLNTALRGTVSNPCDGPLLSACTHIAERIGAQGKGCPR